MYCFVGVLLVLLYTLAAFAMGVYAVVDFVKSEMPDLYTELMRRIRVRKHLHRIRKRR